METLFDCPLSFVVIALIFLEFRGGGRIPPPVPEDRENALSRMRDCS